MTFRMLAITVIVSALVAQAGACQDNGWTVVHTDANQVITVRPPVGELAAAGTLWVHGEYTARPKFKGFKYASEQYVAEVNCEAGMINRTDWKIYAKPKLQGRARESTINFGIAWRIVPDTVDEWIAQAACAQPPAKGR